MLRRHLNFRPISHRFICSFANPSFQDLNGSYYVLKHDNFKSVEVQGWTPLKKLMFLHWILRPTFTTLLGKRRAISHWMAVPKNHGKCKSATISLHRGDSLSMSCIVCSTVNSRSGSVNCNSATIRWGRKRVSPKYSIQKREFFFFFLSVLIYLWCLLKHV